MVVRNVTTVDANLLSKKDVSFFLIVLTGEETRYNFKKGIEEGKWGFWSTNTYFISDDFPIEKKTRKISRELISSVIKEGDFILFFRKIMKKDTVVRKEGNDYFKGFPRINYKKLSDCIVDEIWLTEVKTPPYQLDTFSGFYVTIDIEPQDKPEKTSLDLSILSDNLRMKIAYLIVSYHRKAKIAGSILNNNEVRQILSNNTQ